MNSIRHVSLVEVRPQKYCLFAEDGHAVSSVRHFGTPLDALEWGKQWCSSWGDIELINKIGGDNGED